MSWFKAVFNKKREILDLSAIAVDMHNHLLPAIDDGAETNEESVDIIKKMAELGYEKLIFTPHINGRFPNTKEKILAKFNDFKTIVERENIPVKLGVAAEYFIEDGFEKILENGDLLTFGNNYVLVELSYFMPYPLLSSLLFDIQTAGYNVILAHPERYTYWHKNLKDFETLKDREVMFQINFSSLTGSFSNEVRNITRKLIDENWVDFAGSDVHNNKYLELLIAGLHDPYAEKLIASGKLKNLSLL